MTAFFLTYGPNLTYFGIIVFLILTGAGLPIPEEVPIVTAGVLSFSDGTSPPFLNPYLAFAACLIGAILGDIVVYSIGRFLGTSFFRRHPRFAHLLHEEREKQMEDLIRRHGLKVFFVARFMVGIRAPLYIAAGVLRVSWRRFLLVDAFCATVVVSAVFWLSYFYGRVVGEMLLRSQKTLTVAAVIIAVGVGLIYLMRRRRASRSMGSEKSDKPAATVARDKPGTKRVVA